MAFRKSITRMFEHKRNMEITLQFKMIYAHQLPENLDFVDLAIVWRRGTEQVNETRGYELNYLENDMEMDEVFRRVSGFYSKDPEFNKIQEKQCIFELKEYKQLNDKRIDKGTIIG